MRLPLHGLNALNESLDNKLILRQGNAKDVLDDIIKETGANAVYWNRCYEPWRMQRDKDIKAHLKDSDIDANSYNGSLLYEPWQTLKDDNTPYRVFTPFYKKGCLLKFGGLKKKKKK